MGLVALGAACDESGDCNGALRFGGAATTDELTESGDELIVTTEYIDFTLDDGEDLTVEIPCADIDLIVSRDVTVQSFTTGNVGLVEESFDNGDGICGFNYLPMGHDGSRWLGEPQACDSYLAEATIEMQAYRAADTLNSKAAMFDETITWTAEMEFFTACPYSVEVLEPLGTWRGIAIAGDGRLYLASDDQFGPDSYMKSLEGFNARYDPNISRVSLRLSVSDEELQSVKLISDENAGVLIDMTYEDNKCYVDAYDSVTGVRMWSKTLADDSVDSYQCVGMDSNGAAIVVLESVDLAEWANAHQAVRRIDILTGEESERTVIDPAIQGYESYDVVKWSADGKYLMLAVNKDSGAHLLKANLELTVFDDLASDTDFTQIRDFASDVVEGVYYTLEDVFVEDSGYIVTTLIKRNAEGDVLVRTEIAANYSYEGDGLEAQKLIMDKDHVYVIASSDDGFAAIAKIEKRNMKVVWESYAIGSFLDFALDELSATIVIMGEEEAGRIAIPIMYRISVYGHHFGNVFIDGLDALMAVTGGGGGDALDPAEGP